MFYDRLLLITSLKSRLLSSSSFSQLYTSEKLPLRKFRREGLSLTPLIAGLLAACGGGTTYVPIGDITIETPGTGGGTAGDFKVYVQDGAVEGAKVYANGVLIGETDSTGSVVVPAQYRNAEITVDLTGATDLFTGEKFESGTYTGTLPAGADETVISPISTIIDGLVDDETTVEDVLEMIFGEDSGITIEDVTDPTNFHVGDADAGSKPLGNPERIADEIARASIELEILLSENTDESGVVNFDGEDGIGEALEDGFDAADDLTTAGKTEADARIDEAQDRAEGQPFALPDITSGDTTDSNYAEDTNVAIDIEDWGFRDPFGNSDDRHTELVSITIAGITIGGEAGGALHLADGTVISGTITLAQLEGLYFVPAENKFGDVEITYVVNDGEVSSDPAVLKFTIDSVNDVPSDIRLGGDRSNSNNDRADSTDGGLYVLVDGEINSAGAANGQLAVIDVEDGDDGVIVATDTSFSDNFVLSGEHGALFEIVTTEQGGTGTFFTTLKLKEDATPLADGGIYKITISYTDSDGGTYSENYEIVQGGLYVQPAGTTDAENRVYNDGAGLVNEEYNGDATTTPTAGVPFVLGQFAREDAPAPSSTVTISYELTADTEGNYDNDLVMVATDGTITFIGADSGDYDTATNGGERDSLTIQITSKINAVNNFAGAATFTGQEGADASGATGDADTRTFSYSGGGITKTDVAVVTAVTPVKATATVADGANNVFVITANTAGVAFNNLNISFAAFSATGNTSDPVIAYSTSSGITISYGVNGGVPTVDALIALIKANTTSLTIGGETGTFSDFFDIEAHGDRSGDSGTYNSYDFNSTAGIGTFTGGVDEVVGDVAHRTIDVATGNIYLPDGTEISFAAATGLRVPATDGVNEYYVIVDDADGDGTYEVRVVASLPDGDGHYVLGTVGALAVVAEAASYTVGDASASATFTAKTAGVAGNSYDVDTYASGVADTTILVELVGSGNVDINITYGDNATLQHLIDAFAEGTLAANIFALYDLTASGDTSVLLSTLLPDGESYSLTGGVAAGAGAAAENNVTGTAVATAKQLTWTQAEEKTHEYVINLKNIDDNAPIFSSDSSVAVSVTENADRDTVGVIFTAQAADADGETIVYSLAGGDGLFEIDATTGEVRLVEGRTADYEAVQGHTLTITATSTGTLTATTPAVSKTAIQELTVTIVNENEAPTSVRLNADILTLPTDSSGEVTDITGGVLVGRVIIVDPDADDTHTIALTGTDASLFEVRRVGANWELYFIGSADDLKGPGQTYDVAIEATDSGGLSVSTTSGFAITENGLAVTPTTANADPVYSNGASLLAENAVGSSTAIVLGALSDNAGSTSFSTSTTGFKVNASGQLTYEGAGADYEAGATLPVVIIASKEFVAVASGFTGHNVAAADTNGANGGKAYGYSGGTISKTDTASAAVAAVAASVTVTSSTSTSDEFVVVTAKTAGAGFNGVKLVLTASNNIQGSPIGTISYDSNTNTVTITANASSANNGSITDFITALTGDTSSMTINGQTGTFSTFFTATVPTGVDGTDTPYDIGTPSGGLTFAGGADATDATPASRTIDVVAGSIYLLDGTKIDFGAVTNLLVEADSWVIVDDVDGDGTYEARVVAKTETLSGEYYIIGEVRPHPDAVAASYTYEGRNAAVSTSVTFTAKTAGTDGNSLKVTGSSGSASLGFSYDSGTKTLTINYDGSTHTVADLVAAFTDSGLAAEIAALYEISFIGDDTNLLNNVLSISTSTLAGGGVDTAPTQIGTMPSGGVLTLVDTTTYNYVVVLGNLDDSEPVFGTAVLAEDAPATFTYTESTKTLDGVPEDVAADVVLLIVSATDADNVADADPTDTIVYSLAAGVEDNDFFSIDGSTGAVTLRAGQADFETKRALTIKVTATSTSTLAAGGATGVVTLNYTINLTDANDAPTGASFARSASFGTSANIGTVNAIDPDSAGVIGEGGRTALDAWTFALVLDAGAADGKTTDTGLFTIDANTGALSFTDTTSTGAGLGARKDLGELYLVRVQVTDSAGETITVTLTIAEGTVTITPSGGTAQYSGYTDADGDGFVPENANFAALGQVAAGTAVIGLGGVPGGYTPVGADLPGIDSAGTILIVKDGIDYDSITVIFDVNSTALGAGSTLAITIAGTTRDPIITFVTTDATINGTALGAAISGDADVDAIFSVTGGTGWIINAATTYTITPDNDNDDFFIMTTAAVTIGSTSSDTSFTQAVVTTAGATFDGGKFVVLTVNASDVVTGMSLKSTLAAGDLVVGRLSADATELTSFGLAGFTLALASNTITMAGYTPVTGAITAQTNQLVYIGSDSGDYESDDTLVVDFSVGQEVLAAEYTSGALVAADIAGSKFHYTASTGAIGIVASTATIPAGSVLLGTVNSAGTGVTVADGFVSNIFTVTTASTNTTFTIAAGTALVVTTERYVVQLADVNEAPTFDVAGADDIALDEGGTITITEAMLGLSDVDAGDQVAGELSGLIKLAVSGLVNGTFHKDDAATAITEFFLDDVRQGKITFVQDGGEKFDVDANGFLGTTATPTKFTLIATDIGGLTSAPATFFPEVTDVNDAPEGTTTNPIKRQMTLGELNVALTDDLADAGDTALGVYLGVANLLTPDADNTPSQITYTLEGRTTDDGRTVLLENGKLQKYDVANTPTKWQTLEIGGTFTQQDIIEGKIRYMHNGSETTTDRFNFTVSDGDNTISGEIFNITITPVNDQPTLIGDNEVVPADAGAKEGLTYTFTEDDLGATDPDDDPENVTYIIGTLPAAAQGKLQVDGVNAVANTTTFTLADLIDGKVKFKHDGLKPVATSFTYVVRDDGNDGPDGLPDGTGVVNSAIQTFDLEFKEVNDEPSAPDLGISRIDPLTAPGATVATLSTTDEETTDQAAFTYALVSGEGDNAYFEFNGRILKFKNDLGSLKLKLEGDNYVITLTVTDVGVGSDPDQAAITRTETYTIPVRSFDIDWDTSTSGVQGAPTIAADLATNMITVGAAAATALSNSSGGIAIDIGTFRIDPGNNIVLGEYAAGPGGLAGSYETDYGTVTVSAPKGNSGQAAQTFDVTFTINEDSELLKAIVGGAIKSVDFAIEVRYTRDGALEASFPLAPEVDGFRRSLAIFTIDFTGKNDPPEAVDFVVFEDLDKPGTTSGTWRFTDPDTGATIAPNGLLVTGASGTAVDTDITFGLDPSDANYVGSDTVDGTYGTLTVNADGTWSYARVADDIDPVSLAGGKDVFLINVRDDKNVVGETALTVTINIRGENDAPTLQANSAVGTNIVTSDRTTSTGDLTAAVTELTPATPSTVVITDTVAIAAATAGQKASGQWRAHDVDDGATMRLFSGEDEIGTIDTTTPLPPPLVFEGRYGTITFTTPNSGADAGIWKWEYVLNARAEKIASGQTPVEVFALTVRDEYGAISNDETPIVLTITVTGTNDNPTALAAGTTTDTTIGSTTTADKGTVIESGFRTDNNVGDDTITSAVGGLATPAYTSESDTELERRTDDDTNGTVDELGRPVIHGQLDAVDIDRVGTDGRPFSAIDAHTFQIWGGDGATSQAVHVNGVGGVTVVTDSSSVVTNTSFVGTYGELTLNATTGKWTYTLNNQDSATYGLNVGDTGTDTFTIRIDDPNGGEISDTLVITITGTADAPILSVDTSGGAATNDLAAGEAGGTANATVAPAGNAAGVFTFTDDDANDTTDGFGTAVQLQGRVGSAAFSDGSDTANTNKGTKYAGTYGDFYLKNDGSWSYEVDQARADVLDGGENDKTDSFDVRIDNTRGSTTIYSNVITVEVSIAGANDAPTVVVTSGATLDVAVTEEGDGPLDATSDDVSTTTNNTAEGSLTYADVDGDDIPSTLKVYLETSSTAETTTTEVTTSTPATFTSVGTSTAIADGDYGDFTFTINTAGTLTWEFELDAVAHTAVAGLTASTTATAKAWVRIVDPDGLSARYEVSVTITGTEDKPVLSAHETGAVVEDGTASDTGTFTVTDPDADDTGFSASDLTLQGVFGTVSSTNPWAAGSNTANSNKGTSFAGVYGTFYLQADGDWSYELDNTNATVQALGVVAGVADTLTEVLNVRVTDSDGADSDTRTVTVTISGVNDDPVIAEGDATDDGVRAVSVTEGTDRTVVTLTATDVDTSNTSLTYSLSGTDAADFSIVASTGVVTFAADPAFDAVTTSNNTKTFTFTATDDDGGTDSVTVTVTIASANTAPVFNTTGASGGGAITTAQTDKSVAENTATTTTVVDVGALDYDADGDALTYTLSGDDAGDFEISAAGLLTFKTAPDFEAAADANTDNVYTVTVTATDPENAVATITFTITVTDVNDVPPTISSGATGTARDENTEIATTTAVYTAAGTFDVTPITWSLTGTNSGLFNISNTAGATYGQVTFKAAHTPDYETIDSYSFNVVATSGSLSATQAVTIAVNDLTESGPEFTSSETGTARPENSEIATTATVYTAVATPATAGNAITYSLSSAGDGGDFNIGGTSGIVTFKVATTPDHETKPSYTFTVIATETGNTANPTSLVVTVNVTDFNDVAPTITSAATGTVTDDVALSTTDVVYTATGTYDVSGISWSLTGTDAGLFNINSDGEVTFKMATTPDFESGKTSYSFTLTATSGSLTPVTQAVVISVTDVEENVSPIFTADGLAGTALAALTAVSIDENSAANTQVIDFSDFAYDENSGDTLTYALSGTDASAFTLDTATGELTINAIPNFENKPSYSVSITVSDNVSGSTAATASLTINVTNQPEAGTAADVTGSSATGAGYAVVGDALTAGAVTDPDGPVTASSLQYQWQVSDDGTAGSWTDISGATNAAYTVAVAQGKHVRVRTTYTAGGYASSMAFSAAVIIDTTTTGTVTITHADVTGGTANQADQGEALTAVTSGLSDADDASLTFAYQWAKNGTDIATGGTSATLLGGAVDADGVYTVVVTATDDMAGVITTFTASINVGVVETGLIKPTADGLTEVDGTAAGDTLTSTSATEIIQGGNDDDTITAGAGDVVIGGFGRDMITLPVTSSDSTTIETVVWRYNSQSSSVLQAADGGDVLTGFGRGQDKLILVELGEAWHISSNSAVSTKADITESVILSDFITRADTSDTSIEGLVLAITASDPNGDPFSDADYAAGYRLQIEITTSAEGYKYGLTSTQTNDSARTTLIVQFDISTSKWFFATSAVTGVGNVYNFDIITNNLVVSTASTALALGEVSTANGLRYLFGEVDADYAEITGNDDFIQFTIEDGLGVDIL